MPTYERLLESGWRVIDVEIDGNRFQIPRYMMKNIEKDSVTVVIKVRYVDHDEEARADVEELLQKWESAGKKFLKETLRDMGLWKIFSTQEEQVHEFRVPMKFVSMPDRIDNAIQARNFIYDSSDFIKQPARRRASSPEDYAAQLRETLDQYTRENPAATPAMRAPTSEFIYDPRARIADPIPLDPIPEESFFTDFQDDSSEDDDSTF